MNEKKLSVAVSTQADKQPLSVMLNVHSIESLGTFDGPGIRFVVFLQGCPMRCLYCANPDTMRHGSGEEHAVDDLIRQIERLSTYYAQGGGVTASGGEPCCQAQQLIPFFQKMNALGIHTALDTNGYVFNKNVENLLDHTDLVLLDIKHMDASMHEIITGRDNQRVLQFAEYLRKINKPTWLRYVLVPQLTDQPDKLHALGNYFKDFINIEKFEIQPYHELGKHKWELMNKKYPLEGTPLNTPEQLENARAILEQYFKEVVIN